MRNYLKAEELEVLMNAQIDDLPLNILRHSFIFGCMYGLSLSEMATLTKQNICIDNEQKYLKIHRKGRIHFEYLPLEEVSLATIQMFEHNEFCKQSQQLFPFFDIDALNAQVKQLSKYINADIHITKSTPIKTFYKNIYNNMSNDSK